MPTYEYACAACEHQFEQYQSFSEAPIKKCPKCGKAKASRIISGGAGVVFKGGGFYETDYKRGAGSEYKKKADSEKPAAASEAPKAHTHSNGCCGGGGGKKAS